MFVFSTPEWSDNLRQEVDLNSVLVSQCNRHANVRTVRTVTTNTNSQVQEKHIGTLPVTMEGGQDTLWLPELERYIFNPTVRRRSRGVVSCTPVEIQCLHWGRGLIPAPGVCSAAIPLGEGLAVHYLVFSDGT